MLLWDGTKTVEVQLGEDEGQIDLESAVNEQPAQPQIFAEEEVNKLSGGIAHPQK